MADNTLKNKYFIKKSISGTFTDITTLVDGVRILEVKGMFDEGKAINVYNAQWVNSQTEDFMITKTSNLGVPIVVRENADISITFIVGNRYTNNTIDVAEQHEYFIRHFMDKDIWILSSYTNRSAHCMALDSYSPTTTKLHRGGDSYILGTIKLHMLEKQYVYDDSSGDDDEHPDDDEPDNGNGSDSGNDGGNKELGRT